MTLPINVQVVERGWLSANQILLRSDNFLDVVDSGFCTHISQTIQLLDLHANQFPDVQPRFLCNTHLHSDHCGGNSALIEKFGFKALVPVGEFDAVQDWDEDRLGFNDLGQPCPTFTAFGVYQPDTIIALGSLDWEVHQAPGHDNEAQLLFNHDHRLLIAGDALWEKGFGALFPDSSGYVNFEGAAATLELIDQLHPSYVIPGHGSVFTHVNDAVAFAMNRLNYLAANPTRNLRQVCNVLLKFKLLEWQECDWQTAQSWFGHTPMLQRITNYLQIDIANLFQETVDSLVQSKVIQVNASPYKVLRNC